MITFVYDLKLKPSNSSTLPRVLRSLVGLLAFVQARCSNTTECCAALVQPNKCSNVFACVAYIFQAGSQKGSKPPGICASFRAVDPGTAWIQEHHPRSRLGFAHLAAVLLSATVTSYFQSMTCLGRSVQVY